MPSKWGSSCKAGLVSKWASIHAKISFFWPSIARAGKTILARRNSGSSGRSLKAINMKKKLFEELLQRVDYGSERHLNVTWRYIKEYQVKLTKRKLTLPPALR